MFSCCCDKHHQLGEERAYLFGLHVPIIVYITAETSKNHGESLLLASLDIFFLHKNENERSTYCYFMCISVCLDHVYAWRSQMPEEGFSLPNWSYTCLGASMWVLECEPKSFVIGVHVLNFWDISPGPSSTSFRSICLGLALLAVFWAPHINHLSRKCPTDISTGQSVGGNF